MPHLPSASVLLNRLQAKARFRHLQVLVALADQASVSRTADALGLSQPAVTQCLADLERLVDLPLFERLARGVRPTRAGLLLLPLARRMLEALAEGSEALTAARSQGEGTVRVAAITGAVGGLLVQALPAFARAHPEVLVQARECDPAQWPALLAAGDVDLALVREPLVTPAGQVFTPLCADSFVVVCRPGHRLARRRGLGWADLAGCTWLPQAAGSAARELLDTVLAGQQPPPPMASVVTRVSALTLALVESLDVLALLPASVARPWLDRGQLLRVDVSPLAPFRPLGIAMPATGAPQAAASFAGFLVRFAGGTG